jgi:hypothetical protein
MSRHLVISVAGGGALGIGPLAFLCKVEQLLEKSVSDVAQAFAGTSTGAIIAAGLAEGYTAHDLYDLYRGNLKKIFKKYGIIQRLKPKCPTYDNTNLKKVLQENFPGKIGEWKKPVFIPTTHMNGASVEKVWDLGDKDVDKWFAVLTSTAAPTYFDCVYDDKKNCYIDGGMWSNSPVDVLNAGLIKSGWSNYKVLDLETGMDTPNNESGNKTLVGWAEYIFSDWVARSGKSGEYEVKSIIGEKNFMGIRPYVQSKPKMDDISDKTLDKVVELWEGYFYANKDAIKAWLKR